MTSCAGKTGRVRGRGSCIRRSPGWCTIGRTDPRSSSMMSGVVVNAGLMLPVTLGQRLGIEALVDKIVDLGDRPGAARPGRKVLSLAHAMLLGADSIDDCDVLRAGRTEAVLGHHAMAPSTLGTFLRSFSFGHVRQLDQVLGPALARAWQPGAGPGPGAAGDRCRLLCG